MRPAERIEALMPVDSPADSHNERITLDDLSHISLESLPRLERLRSALMNAPKGICIARARLVTQFYKEHGFGSEPGVLLQAKALRHILENLPITIHDDERLVGSTTSNRHGWYLFPEHIATTIWPELPTIASRKVEPRQISDEDVDILDSEIFPFWKDHNVLEYARNKSGDAKSLTMMERMAFFLAHKPNGISHIIPDFHSLVEEGLLSLIARAKAKEASENDPEKKAFYQATQIAMAAVIRFAERYAERCESMAANASPGRAAELLAAAAALRHAPANRPRSFHEAIQAILITHAALHQENCNAGMSPGRLDQHLYPFYADDIAAGNLTPEGAAELIGCFFLKINDHEPTIAEMGRDVVGGTGTTQNVTIGGVRPDGSDASNDVSLLMLRAMALLGLREPNLSARVHESAHPAYIRAISETIYASSAQPAVYNDASIIAAMRSVGYSLEDARDFGVVGCVEPTSNGRTMGMCGAALLVISSALELALHDGVHPLSGAQIGPRTGALTSFKDYDSFYAAYLRQLEFVIAMAVDCNHHLAAAHEELQPTPLLSSLIEGTLESGKDVTAGGAKYNASGMGIVGLADVVDSLLAIKNLVFEEQRISAAEIHDAISCDFKGHEKTLALVQTKAPKYGRNDPEADQVLTKLVEDIDAIFASHKNSRGGRYLPGYWSVTLHAGAGALTGALPNGRRKGAPLASGATPVSGAAKKGPTSSLASSAKLPPKHLGNGMCVNQKLAKSLLAEPGKLPLLGNLIQGYFAKGGMQIQFTVQDAQTLIDAQANPEAHKDLLVRISGYTAYFCDLNKKMQDEIIARAESGL